MPGKICGCSPGSLRVTPGKAIAVVTMNGEDVKNFDFVPFEKKLKKISIPTCFISRVLGLPKRDLQDYQSINLFISGMSI